MTEHRSFIDRVLEIITVLLLAVTTLGTAWCGYQASQWSGVQNDHVQAQSEHLLQANRDYGTAIEGFAYDSGVLAYYAQAVQAGDTALADFYRSAMVRADFLPILEQWEATLRGGGTPTPLLEDQSYIQSQTAAFRDQMAQADAEGALADQAGDNVRDYVLNTILLAVALFFAGVTSSFRFLPARAILVLLALGTVAIAAARMVDLPVA